MALGTVIRSFAAGDITPLGAAWCGDGIWITGQNLDRVFLHDPVSGVVRYSVATPRIQPTGVGWDGRTLWVNSGVGGIDQINLAGTTIRSIATNGRQGMAMDGRSVWVVNNALNLVEQYDLTSGVLIRTIPEPGGGTPRDVAWDGSSLWLCNQTTATIYKLDTDGVVLASFAAPGALPFGITWDGRALWIVVGAVNRIYQVMVN